MKTQLFIVILCIFLLSCTSCEKEDLRGAIWKTPVSNTSALGKIDIDDFVYYEGKIIVPYKAENEDNSLRSLNAETGKVEWTWEDWYPRDRQYGISIYKKLVYNSHYYVGAARRLYVIDLKNGQTVSKQEMDNDDYSNLQGQSFIDNIVFSIFSKPLNIIDAYNEYEHTIMQLDMKHPERGFTPAIFTETGEILYRAIHHQPYKNITGDICLLFPYSILKDNTVDIGFYSNLQWFLAAYNVTQKRYEYKDSTGTDFFDVGITHDNKIYALASNFHYLEKERDLRIFRYDPITRKKDWEVKRWENINRNAPSGYEMAYYDGKFFACGNEYVVCFNAETGIILWEHFEGGGNAQSPFKFLNGVAYWTNAGYLFAIDVNTGTFLLGEGKKGHPENYNSWGGSIGLIPPTNGRKGCIVVHNYKDAYCFEALR